MSVSLVSCHYFLLSVFSNQLSVSLINCQYSLLSVFSHQLLITMDQLVANAPTRLVIGTLDHDNDQGKNILSNNRNTFSNGKNTFLLFSYVFSYISHLLCSSAVACGIIRDAPLSFYFPMYFHTFHLSYVAPR